MQACVVEEPRAVLFRRFEQLCSVSTESERSIHVLEGPGMVTEDYIREAAVDDGRIVIRPARDFALTLVDDRELALCSIVARLPPIGRASCRERVCQYVLKPVVAGCLK